MADKKDDFNFDEDFNFDSDFDFDDEKDKKSSKKNVDTDSLDNDSDLGIDAKEFGSNEDFSLDDAAFQENTENLGQDEMAKSSKSYDSSIVEGKKSGGMMLYLALGAVGLGLIYGVYKYLNTKNSDVLNVPVVNKESTLPSISANNVNSTAILQNSDKKVVQNIDSSLKTETDKLQNSFTNIDNKLSELVKIQTSINNLQKQVSVLESKINTIEQQTNISKNLNTINSSIDALLLALKQINIQVADQHEVLTSFVKSNIGDIVEPGSKGLGLKLEAVIPGRAWLKTKYGAEQTVTLGDYVPGYGKVVQIDAQKGIVVTDTGNILRQN